MARKVFISSDMSVDESISEIAEQNSTAALMWPWILTYFDDWGRAKASPREIKNSVFQANDLITTAIIATAVELYSDKLIKLYEVEGKPYMCIDPDKWFKYQTHIRKEKRENDGSKHPAPPVEDSAQVREGARDYAHFSDNLTDCIPSPSPSLSKDSTTTTTTAEAISEIRKGSAQLAVGSAPVPIENPFRLFESEGFGTISATIGEKLGDFIDTYGDRWVCEAMKDAAYHQKRSLPYVRSILERYRISGVDEPWTVEKDKVTYLNRRSKGPNTYYEVPSEQEARQAARMAELRKNEQPMKYEPII